MSFKRKFLAALSIVVLAAGAFLFTRSQITEQRLVRTPAGETIRLLDYQFKSGNVRYEWYGGSLVQRMVKFLPAAARNKLGFSPVVAVARFPTNHPGLSVAIWPKVKNHPSLRLIASDENGNEYDEAVHDAGWSGIWVKEVRAFPRRGKQLRLKVASGTNVYPQFLISNPAPGPHPYWVAHPLPAVSTNGHLQVKLIDFRSLRSGKLTFTRQGMFPKTELGFEVFEKGIQTVQWQPISIEFSDATGNRWHPSHSSEWNKIEGTQIRSTVSGALWKGENAWKMNLEFRKTGGFADDELVRLEQIPIPGPYGISQPNANANVAGVSVEILAVIGRDVEWNRIYQWNPERVSGALTVLIKGDLVADNCRLDFVKALDDQGRPLELVGKLGQASRLSGNQFVPYSLNFKPSNDANAITIVAGVARSQSFEFIAKPEQQVLEAAR